MLLTPDDVRSLTGRRHADAQIAALQRMGLRFVLDADGRPKVAQAEADRVLLSKPAPRKIAGPRMELVR